MAYNLSVQGIHTYHVGASAILVHNACPVSYIAGSSFRALKHSTQGIGKYSAMRKLTAGHGGATQAHHLIEKRFANVIGGSTDDWMRRRHRSGLPHARSTRTIRRS